MQMLTLKLLDQIFALLLEVVDNVVVDNLFKNCSLCKSTKIKR
jgi:hypothetical protein